MINQVTKWKTADGSLWSTYELASEHEKTLNVLDQKRQMKELAKYQNILKRQRARTQQNIVSVGWYTAKRYALEKELSNITDSINKNTRNIRVLHILLGHTENRGK